ncbi:unnamed protein product [Phytophthora lilii]|uniref:Unnamed protein product n=1 Tax=Phytophthora lilii TaxID=2077276 RepID=A0A9W6TXI5_9STRA|nr:unnamed protein product [Phytophthora lilii]
MMEQLQRARNAVWEAWMSVQVEYQGSYSVERLQKLESYMVDLSAKRVLLVCVLTPFPCLALSLLKELPPLAPAEDGVYKNGVFFARAWGILCFMGVSALVQMGHGAPRLKLTNWQIALVSWLAATVSIAFIFGLCAFTVFPLPFGLLIAGPPFVLVIGSCFTHISGKRWRSNPALLVEVKRQLVVYQCQTTLPFVYPLYILGFVSLTGWDQVIFVAVLPIIQIIAKNWISRALADDNDQKPQCVIFVVEVYNALYVSNVLQTATSWASTGAIMVVDLLQFWVSMIDIVGILDEMNILMAKIPQNHPLANKTFVQVAILMNNKSKRLSQISGDALKSNLTVTHNIHNVDYSKYNSARPEAKLTKSQSEHKIFKKSILRKPRVSPIIPPAIYNKMHSESQKTALPELSVIGTPEDSHCELEGIFSGEERAMFIEKSAHVLFITEYLVLVEYVEVVLPLVYCMYYLEHDFHYLCWTINSPFVLYHARPASTHSVPYAQQCLLSLLSRDLEGPVFIQNA